MNWQWTPFIIPLIIGGVASIGLAVLSWRRDQNLTTRIVVILLLSIALWNLGYAIELASTNLPTKKFWDNIQLIGTAVLSISWLALALHYSNRQDWLSPRNLTLLSIFPAIFLPLAFTNDAHGLAWSNTRLDQTAPFLNLVKDYGIAMWGFIAYVYGIIILGSAVLSIKLIQAQQHFIMQGTALIFGALVPLLVNILDILKLNPWPYIQPTAFALSITGLSVVVNLDRLRMGDLKPVAHKAVLNGMVDCVIVVDDKERVIEINDAAQELIKNNRNRTIGKPLREVIPDWYALIEKATKNDSGSAELRVVNESEPHFFDVRISPVRDRRGNLLSQVIDFRDITESKKAQQALRNYADKLEQRNQELRQFSYIASHDLQEPLRMISSYVQLLEKRYRGKLDEDADEFIQFSVDGAKRMRELINALLTYSHVGAADENNNFTHTNCNDIVQNALDNLKATIDQTEAELTVDPLPTIQADPRQLEQLFQNLISNGIKFNKEPIPKIRICAQPQNGQWCFSVKDNGIGIDPKYQDRIFLIFQRLHTKDEYPGTGVGLAICKRIVEQHGGKIWMESKPGNGTTFYFTLHSNGGQRP